MTEHGGGGENRGEEVLLAVANAQRRTILRFLRDGDGVATVDEIAATIARKNEMSDRDVELSLHHRHLPHLEKAGLIEWDARSDIVRYSGDPLAEDVLGAIREHR